MWLVPHIEVIGKLPSNAARSPRNWAAYRHTSLGLAVTANSDSVEEREDALSTEGLRCSVISGAGTTAKP